MPRVLEELDSDVVETINLREVILVQELKLSRG